jgi:hypothetical protein
MKHSKLEITKAVLNEIPHNLTDDHTLPIEKVIFKWWVGGRTGSGLRLSEVGFEAFTKAKIAYYEFPLVSDKTDLAQLVTNLNSFILTLSKKIKCPFYLDARVRNDKKTIPTIRIYDDKIAMMVTLYGTLQEYLDSSAYK